MFEFFKSKKSPPAKAKPGKVASRPITVKTPPSRAASGQAAVRPDADAPTQAMTPERAQLIKQALSVHRAQQGKLAELSGEDRKKLMMMFFAGMLRQARGKRDDELE